jgi:exodeoxyribonuclease VII small subunit
MDNEPMAKKKIKTNTTTDESPPRFEQALQQLQQIVGALEEGSLGLEESMQQFEHGVALLRTCHTALEQAEQQIEVLTGFDADGNPVAASFDASASAETESPKAGRRKQTAPQETPGSQGVEDSQSDGTLFS